MHQDIRPFPSSKNPHFRNEAKCKTFLVVIVLSIKYLWEGSHFLARAIKRRRKAWFLLRMTRIFFAANCQTQLDHIAHEQTIICRQLFAGHVVGSQPMKRKNFAWNDDKLCLHENKNHLHISGFALSLALKKRLGATRKMGYKTAAMLVFKSGEVCDIR